MICVGLLIMWCSLPSQAPVDSFCLTYQRVVQEKGDGDIKATLGVKRRVLANELVYKKHCEGKK